jgi:ribonuclease HII
VTRDRLMVAAHADYAAYDFATHKGYGTATHAAALQATGPSPIHRRSFAPIRALVMRDTTNSLEDAADPDEPPDG